VFRSAAGVLLRALPYPALLAGVTLLLDTWPADRRAELIADWSTDLANLADHPARAMLLSGLVAEGDLVPWALLALAGLAALGTRLGAARAVALAAAVHVLATLASQGLVLARIRAGALPPSARVMSDVGPSYVVVAALVAAAAYARGAARVVAVLGFAVLTPSLFTGLPDLDVAAVGHVASIGLALGLGAVAARVLRRDGAVIHRD
jgi:hypothetical protein